MSSLFLVNTFLDSFVSVELFPALQRNTQNTEYTKSKKLQNLILFLLVLHYDALQQTVKMESFSLSIKKCVFLHVTCSSQCQIDISKYKASTNLKTLPELGTLTPSSKEAQDSPLAGEEGPHAGELRQHGPQLANHKLIAEARASLNQHNCPTNP